MNENKHGCTQFRYLWGPDGPSPLRRPLAEWRWVSEEEEYTPCDMTCQSCTQPQRSMRKFSAFKFEYNVILCGYCFNNAVVLDRWRQVQLLIKYFNRRNTFNLRVTEPKENEWYRNWKKLQYLESKHVCPSVLTASSLTACQWPSGVDIIGLQNYSITLC